ncbi:MAG TPA: hypothetical protein VNX28_11340, partial [Gemmataceae bacterium]|nr:hypothetical protein [Gemmataceae bacterium]
AADQQRILETINKLPASEQTSDSGSANGNESSAKSSIWAKLQAIGRASEVTPCELPSDLAANHDFYLHRLPRRS